MKIIRVMETAAPIRNIYRHVETQTQRELLGYIIRKGYTDDYVMLGALHLLREIERAKANKILYQLCLESPYANEIIELTELAQQRAFRQFALPAREVKRCIYLMSL